MGYILLTPSLLVIKNFVLFYQLPQSLLLGLNLDSASFKNVH